MKVLIACHVFLLNFIISFLISSIVLFYKRIYNTKQKIVSVFHFGQRTFFYATRSVKRIPFIILIWLVATDIISYSFILERQANADNIFCQLQRPSMVGYTVLHGQSSSVDTICLGATLLADLDLAILSFGLCCSKITQPRHNSRTHPLLL